MMSEAEIQAYLVELEFKMRHHHEARMRAMEEKRYYDMDQANRKFLETAARIDTIDKILKE